MLEGRGVEGSFHESDPKAVLAEHGMDVPDGMDVKVVENADNCVHITMPAPPSGSNELSDEELSNAAGGYKSDNTSVCCGAPVD